MARQAMDEIRAAAFDDRTLTSLTAAYLKACGMLGNLANDANRLRVAHGIVAYARSGLLDVEILASLAVRLVKGDPDVRRAVGYIDQRN